MLSSLGLGKPSSMAMCRNLSHWRLFGHEVEGVGKVFRINKRRLFFHTIGSNTTK